MGGVLNQDNKKIGTGTIAVNLSDLPTLTR